MLGKKAEELTETVDDAADEDGASETDESQAAGTPAPKPKAAPKARRKRPSQKK